MWQIRGLWLFGAVCLITADASAGILNTPPGRQTGAPWAHIPYTDTHYDFLEIGGRRIRVSATLPQRIWPPRRDFFFLQGLADSLSNHTRMYDYPVAEGDRVFTFDFPGQGGSEGSLFFEDLEDLAYL